MRYWKTICCAVVTTSIFGCRNPPGLVVTHSPNPCDVHSVNSPRKPHFPYMWYYRTEVRNDTDEPIQITRFEAYIYQNSNWVPGNIMTRPLTANDFSKWYTEGAPITNGWIQPHTSAVCDPNWHGMPIPNCPRIKWTYDGVGTKGKTYHVEAEITSVPILGLVGGRQTHESEPQAQTTGVNVTAQLNHRIMPLDRGARYEDPLNEALKAKHYGEIDGGGTMPQKSGEIDYIDVEMILTDTTNGIPFVIAKLEALGAPKGSVLKIREGNITRELPFGKAEGLAVYLDGVNLPDEVYKSCDVNTVVDEFNKRLSGHGSFQGHWEGPRETALYLYGEEAEGMKNLISDSLLSYPLCKGARVVTIAPSPK